ncbi:hypothetical protein [Maribacter sp. 1_MG-2023]|uniref:hypothetical protein n=1 Tax=Maribacter sp. 1_MG-2023 TaxID=3062677 RepID=UPI0026E3A6B8|nr:hypothetical protein [Maribacter sp. 1_MG-2023]MDO6473310.1 hypothetical protein [Maribacter sp. 1_MG-2023]
MNCYKHHEIIAVSQCKGCGRGMCPECTEQFSVPSCDNCRVQQEKTIKGETRVVKTKEVSSVLLELILTVIAGLIGQSFMSSDSLSSPDDGPILSAITKYIPFLVSAGFVSGWYIINALKPKQKPNTIKVTVTRSDDFSGCIGIILKFFGAGFIGVYVLPFRTVYNIYRIFK